MSDRATKLPLKMRSFAKSQIRSVRYADLFVALLLTLPVLIFIVWPIVEVIVKSFLPEGFFSLEIYRNLFVHHYRLIFDSILSAILSTVLTIILALAIAVYVAFCSARFKRSILVVLMLTMISPPFVSSLAYIMLFGKRGYIVHHILGLTWNPYGMHGVILMQVLSNISLAALLIIGMFAMLDPRTLEASRDLGGKSWRTLCSIVLPLSMPGIVAAGFIVLIKCLADFGTPVIIGGRFTLLATEAYLAVIGRGNLPLASAISVIILIPSLMAFFFYRHYIRQTRGVSVAMQRIDDRGIEGLAMGSWASSTLGMLTWFFLFLMLLQYAAILFATMFDYRQGHFIFTLEHIQAIRLGKMTSFVRSLCYSFIAAIGVSLFGALLSYYLERHKGVCSKVVDFLSTLPYILPGPFFGIGYILAFNDAPLALTGTSAIVVLNCMFRQLPVSTKATSAGLTRIDPETENAATDLGSGRLRLLFQIILPLLKPAFLMSFINTFTATMTTVGAIIFLITPQAKVATVELFNVLRDGDYGQGAVLASMIIISTLCVNLVFTRWVMRRNG